MRVTVFTPTYNRAHTLAPLYHSLCEQTFLDFEWLIVDDGSTDDTESLIAGWIRDHNEFSIRYYKQPNAGKHTAINRGVSLANGELFFIVDSDDRLPPDALEQIDAVENTIKNKSGFAGVCGVKGYFDGRTVGASFDGQILDITTSEREKYGVTGDKAEVFYTDILREYPFPVIKGEKFMTEAVVWDRIAHDGYKLRFFNEIVYLCEYRDDGLTARYDELYDKYPIGYALFYGQRINFGLISGSNAVDIYKQFYDRLNGRYSLREIAGFLQTTPADLYYATHILNSSKPAKKMAARVIQKLSGGNKYDS